MSPQLSQPTRDVLEAEAARVVGEAGVHGQLIWVGQYIRPYHYAACARCGQLSLPADFAACPGHAWTTRADIDRWQARYAEIMRAGVETRKMQDAEKLAATIGPPTRYEHEVQLTTARIKAKAPAPKSPDHLGPNQTELAEPRDRQE